VSKINKLIKGSKHFANAEFKKYKHKFDNLVKNGQHPKTLFIGCSDSRVIPTLITNSDPGDLFVIRNIGNFVPKYQPDSDFHSTAAAIEYAVSVLEVRDIIVCGHSYCGAIEALYKPVTKDPDLIHVKKWLELGSEPKALVSTFNLKTKKRVLRATEEISTLFQLENLLTYPAIQKRVKQDKLFLNAWHYRIKSGKIYSYDFDQEQFLPL